MPGEENPRILDSMALGFFVCGEYQKAVDTQARALSLVPEEDEDLRRQLESKLEKYRTALTALPPGALRQSTKDDPDAA